MLWKEKLAVSFMIPGFGAVAQRIMLQTWESQGESIGSGRFLKNRPDATNPMHANPFPQSHHERVAFKDCWNCMHADDGLFPTGKSREN